MMRGPVGRRRVIHEALVASALVIAVLIVGANFVLVEVRLLGLELETRLGWALIVALLVGFGAGMLYRRQ